MRDYVPVSPRLIHGRRLRERSQDGEIFRNTDDAVRVPVKRVAVMNNFSECDVLVIVGDPAGSTIASLFSCISGDSSVLDYIPKVCIPMFYPAPLPRGV